MDNPAQRPILSGMSETREILITGGGLVGASLALALAGPRCNVTVIDAAPRATRAAQGFDGRSYALALTSRRMLVNLGLWDGLAAQAQPILEIKVSDGHAGAGPAPFFLHFDHAEIEEGPMGFMVEDRHLRPALLDAMDARAEITQVNGQAVAAQMIDDDGVTLTLADGRQLRGDLLIGADGRDSGSAARAGITRVGWDYGQTALVCAIAHERPHEGIAHQFFMPPGPLAILPLKGNRASIVWSEEKATAQAFQALDDDAYLDMLRPRFGDFLGDIRLEGARFTYPLSLSLAQSFVAPRLALVGDAAHGLHPIAGQGLNVGLRDVAALAEVLGEAIRRGEDVAAPDVLARYQQWRRFDTVTMALVTDVTNRLFSNDNPVLRGLRDLGLGAVNALPSLRRGLIREAAGLTGELPALMRR